MAYTFPRIEHLDRHSHFHVAANNNNVNAVKSVLSANGVSYTDFNVLYNPTIQRISFRPSFQAANKLARLEKQFQFAVGDERATMTMEAGIVNIDVPNASDSVLAGDLIGKLPRNEHINIPVGLDMNRNVVGTALDKAPHMLVAGCTGSGKSVFLNTCIVAMLMQKNPDELNLILVDPKRVEFAPYAICKGVEVVNDEQEAIEKLHWLNDEMQRRYSLFARAGARDIDEYNKTARKTLPRIVLIVDELSQLMSGKDKKAIEADIVKIAQLSRAAGIHMILATQYPVASVVTGLIKQNIPTKVCLQTTNYTGSVVMLGRKGAEKLMGKGDLLFVGPNTDFPIRLQGGYISTQNCVGIANYVSHNKKKLFSGEWIYKGVDGTTY